MKKETVLIVNQEAIGCSFGAISVFLGDTLIVEATEYSHKDFLRAVPDSEYLEIEVFASKLASKLDVELHNVKLTPIDLFNAMAKNPEYKISKSDIEKCISNVDLIEELEYLSGYTSDDAYQAAVAIINAK